MNDAYNNRVKNRASTLDLVYNCTDCGAPVHISLGHLMYFQDNGLVAPFRCSDCTKRKNDRKVEVQ